LWNYYSGKKNDEGENVYGFKAFWHFAEGLFLFEKEGF